MPPMRVAAQLEGEQHGALGVARLVGHVEALGLLELVVGLDACRPAIWFCSSTDLPGLPLEAPLSSLNSGSETSASDFCTSAETARL